MKGSLWLRIKTDKGKAFPQFFSFQYSFFI